MVAVYALRLMAESEAYHILLRRADSPFFPAPRTLFSILLSPIISS